MSHLNSEMSYSATAQISLNDTAIRGLIGKTTNQSTISLADGYGRTNRVYLYITISSNQINYALGTAITNTAGYIAGKTTINVTINSGVYIYSTSTGAYAMTIYGLTSGDTINLTNNGAIRGMGGAGGAGNGGNGGGGGPALDVSINCTLNLWNNGDISGGGGGGGGGAAVTSKTATGGGGGGGGGAWYGPGGGGGAGASGNGAAGGGGSDVSGGAGGAGGASIGTAGAGGGSLGSAGGTSSGAGGAGGTCINGNRFITWQNYGTRNGAIG